MFIKRYVFKVVCLFFSGLIIFTNSAFYDFGVNVSFSKPD